MLLKKPLVGLVAGKTCAVHTRLLSRSHADYLAIVSNTHGIGLGVFEGNCGDYESLPGSGGESLLLSHDFLEVFS